MLSNPAGKITNFAKVPSGIEGSTAHALFRITVYSDRIIRVHFAKEEFDEHSYAVVAEPEAVKWNFEETRDALIISTEEVVCQVNRATA